MLALETAREDGQLSFCKRETANPVAGTLGIYLPLPFSDGIDQLFVSQSVIVYF